MLAAHSTLQRQNPLLQDIIQTIQEVDKKSPKIRNQASLKGMALLSVLWFVLQTHLLHSAAEEEEAVSSCGQVPLQQQQHPKPADTPALITHPHRPAPSPGTSVFVFNLQRFCYSTSSLNMVLSFNQHIHKH